MLTLGSEFVVCLDQFTEETQLTAIDEIADHTMSLLGSILERIDRKKDSSFYPLFAQPSPIAGRASIPDV